MPRRLGRALLAVVAAAVGLGAPSTAVAEPHAEIRWTSNGIPRILATNWRGLGFGYGYAIASQNICVLADTYTTVRAERSRYFGPNEGYAFRGNGTTANNLNSDFFYQRIIDDRRIEALLRRGPPHGPSKPIEDAVDGYVRGYNSYLRKTGVSRLPDPACRGKPWVKKISKMDAYRRFYQLALLASGGVAIDGIGSAQPPGTPGAGGAPPPADTLIPQLQEQLPLGGIGSNAVGLGREATDNGKGMLLGNPHFPWDGSERFFEAQLTIPGKINTSGASLMGVPVVLIGHTSNLAWSHTVSTAFRFTPFEETLVPGSPTTYLRDGQPKEMERDEVTVKALDGAGQLVDRTRTLYSTEHGPMFTSLLGLPLFPWTPARGFAMGDANAANFRYLNHFFEVNRAHSVKELDQILKRNQAIPWVNTIAADSSGKAYYADISVVPHVTDEKAQTCNTELGVATFQALRLPVLDGVRSSCDWGVDNDAVQPGTFGPSNMPKLFRDDYVTNGNDSYWLSNPEQPLEGFNRIIGDERTQRSLRTRSGLVIVRERLNGTDQWPGKRFTMGQLQAAAFGNRQYLGELVRDELVTYCEQNPTILTPGGPVNVSEACPVLEAWNLRDNINSDGAVLFRRFASRVLSSGLPLVPPPAIFRNGFSASDPVDTPNGLNTANPLVGQALGQAVQDLRNASIPLDAPLGDWQYEKRGNTRIPIHGGPGTVGVFNAINVSWSPTEGFPNVPHGSSFVMTAHFQKKKGKRCPVRARTILTYSQSTNGASKFFSDQTRMFSRKQWVKEPFCSRQIARDPALRVQQVRE